MFEFKVKSNDESGEARTGIFRTPHGEFNTPAFIPVGTKGTVKAMTPEELKVLGAEIILANTFHLYLRPGDEIVRELGGLHRFMNWDKPLLTDSGGFQIFSLAELRKISGEGVEFRSPVDGTLHQFTPEKSIEVQNNLGADIIMCLDECVAYPCERDYATRSIQLTIEWAKRCQDVHVGERQALFGIVQGSVYPELRIRSSEETIGLDFPGYAIGGLSVGEPKELMLEILDVTVPVLPKDKPRYLMGIGAPQDIVDAIDRGIDMFDCVIPTRNARNGKLYTKNGSISIKQSKYARDERPISERCECYTCKNYSRAYLRHLYLAGEILSSRLNTVHNLHYFLSLVREIREAIDSGHWKDYKSRFKELLISAPEEE